MAKNAWLIVSDLHLYYKNLRSRVDYVKEMRDVRVQLVQLAARYKSEGWKVNLLLLGDVFHRSYSNTFISNYDNNFFVMWDKMFGECYSVVGNHELHYYASNPFFTLIKNIDSEKIARIQKDIWTPQGLLPTIKVVDRIEDGEVVFHFNHYSTEISKPEEGKVNVGLFHQDVYSQEVVSAMQGKVWQSETPVALESTKGYKYCFFGHMHKMYGVFRTSEGGYLYYLGSLGRTNSSEVTEVGTERCIPVLAVENGKLLRIDENKIELEGTECLKEEVVVESKEQYELQKMRKAAREYAPLDDDPVDGMRSYFEDDPLTLSVLEGLLKNPVDDMGLSIKRKFERLVAR